MRMMGGGSSASATSACRTVGMGPYGILLTSFAQGVYLGISRGFGSHPRKYWDKSPGLPDAHA